MLSGYSIYKDIGNDLIARGRINYDMFDDEDSFSREDKNAYSKRLGTAFETE